MLNAANFTVEHKGLCDYIGESSYLVKFRSRSAFKIELNFTHFSLYEQAASLYNKQVNETYKLADIVLPWTQKSLNRVMLVTLVIANLKKANAMMT